MDIVVKSVLEYIQKQEGHQFSVLAGGAVRDEHFGLTPKDYDLFIPSKNPRQMEELKNSMIKDLGIEDVILKTTVYEKLEVNGNPQNITSVYGFMYADKEFDLIGVKEEDDGDFADTVINSFDYGINMIYDDGVTKYAENSKFLDDLYGRRLTLHNIKTIDGLPKAMERFNKISEKLGGGYRFYCPKLTLKGDDKLWRTKSKFIPPIYESGPAEATEAPPFPNDWFTTPAVEPTPTIATTGGIGWTNATPTTTANTFTAAFNNLNNN